jgi:hypothetical protein
MAFLPDPCPMWRIAVGAMHGKRQSGEKVGLDIQS